MAKVVAPLFGFSASGKLADSLVYLKWKGIHDVRRWLVPANPRTTAQQTQRGYMSDAVDAWHATAYTADDLSAWNLFASLLAKVMSGFNAFISWFVSEKVAGKTPKKCYNYNEKTPGSTTFTIEFDTDMTDSLEATLKYGTSKRALINSVDAAASSGKLTFDISGLTASTKYYCQVVPKDTTERVKTGIYSFTTTSA